MRVLQLTRHIRSRHFVQPLACAQPKPAADQRVPAFAVSAYKPKSHDKNLDIPIAQSPSEHHHAHYKRRRVQLTPYYCPCCIQPCLTPAKLGVHIQKCCPDLFNVQEWEELQEEETATRAWLSKVQEHENANRKQALSIVFTETDGEGNRVRNSVSEVAQRLQLPQKRAEVLFQKAQRCIELPADPTPVQVLYEDDYLLAVNKPPGISTAPRHRFEANSLVNRIIGYLGYNPYPAHRLDMYTSGVVIVAKKKVTVVRLHEMFRDKTIQKHYLALVTGILSPEQQQVDAPIARHPRVKEARVVGPVGDEAQTDVRVLSTSAGTSYPAAARWAPQATASDAGSLPRGSTLVRASPLTGRTHQIRLHVAHLGHPILGDDMYGLQVEDAPRQLLHAAVLELKHPADGSLLTIRAPLPDDFRHALQVCGLQCPPEFL